MKKTICGLDCDECGGLKEGCAGCTETKGRPFGDTCMIAECCLKKGCEHCGNSFGASCDLKEQLIAEFNGLGIEDMETITDLNALKGSFVNLQYTLPGGGTVRFWEDGKIYLGNQVSKKNSDRCYGLTADDNYLLVCEYGEGGSDAQIVIYKRRKIAADH